MPRQNENKQPQVRCYLADGLKDQSMLTCNQQSRWNTHCEQVADAIWSGTSLEDVEEKQNHERKEWWEDSEEEEEEDSED